MTLSFYGLLVSSLLISAAFVARFKNISSARRGFLAILGFCLAFVPLPEIGSLAAWLHGFIGLPSVPLTIFALCSLIGFPLIFSSSRGSCAFTLLFFIVFYTLTLGKWDLDPYYFGFHPIFLVPLLGALMACLYWAKLHLLLWLINLSIIAYVINVYPNIFDALFDPLFAIILVYKLFKRKKNLSLFE